MGRPERSVDAESGPVARLACQLRALRQAAGSPSYRTLAARANYSATVLSRAAGGRELPSLPVVLAYATACGADPAQWEAHWLEAAIQLRDGTGAAAAGAGSAGSAADTAVPGAGRSRAASVRRVLRDAAALRYQALVLVLAMAAASGWATALVSLAGHDGSHTAARQAVGSAAADIRPATPVPTPAPGDGSDPTESGCASDAVTVVQAAARLRAAVVAGISRPGGTTVGLVELRYSSRCHAAWARAIPVPGYTAASAGSVTVTITRRGGQAYSSFRVPALTQVYGDLLLTRDGCLTAAADFRFAGGGRAAARTSCWTRP